MSERRNRPPSQRPGLTDDETLKVFMRSFHAMSQKSYWPTVRAQGRVDLVGKVEVRLDSETGRVSMQKSPLDPMATDLAGAYMRKLINRSDLVSFGDLLKILERTFGQSNHYQEARSIWGQAKDKKFEFLADGDRITTVKMDFPAEWTKDAPRTEGERRVVRFSIADFAIPYFYTGFLHDLDEDRDTPQRRLTRSVPPVFLERMAHLAIAASLYIATIAHHIIGSNRPELCPEDCQEALIMEGNYASLTTTAFPGEASIGQE